MAKTSRTRKSGTPVKKDLAMAGNVAKWLIVIALSGIALSLLFTVVAVVVFALFVAPRITTLAARLQKSPAMQGSARDKCIAFFTEAGKVLSPDDSDEQLASAAGHACTSGRQAAAGAKMFDAAVSGPGHASHIASAAAAAAHAHVVASTAKTTENQLPEVPPNGVPVPHTSDHTAAPSAATAAAPATDLGVHA